MVVGVSCMVVVGWKACCSLDLDPYNKYVTSGRFELLFRGFGLLVCVPVRPRYSNMRHGLTTINPRRPVVANFGRLGNG